MNAVPPPLAPSAGQKNNSCLLGCLVLTGFFVLVAVVGGVGVYFSVKSMFDHFTDTEPMHLPQVALSDAERDGLQEKVDTLIAALTHQNDQRVFYFSADELNALIGMFPQTEWLDGAVYLNVVGSRVFGDVSVPLSQFGFPSERYFNGQATFEVGLYRGELAVHVKELSVKGEPISAEFMQGFSSENLAEGLNEDIEFSNMLNRVESVVVRDGRVEVKLLD